MGAPDCIHRQPFLPSGAACQLGSVAVNYTACICVYFALQEGCQSVRV